MTSPPHSRALRWNADLHDNERKKSKSIYPHPVWSLSLSHSLVRRLHADYILYTNTCFEILKFKSGGEKLLCKMTNWNETARTIVWDRLTYIYIRVHSYMRCIGPHIVFLFLLHFSQRFMPEQRFFFWADEKYICWWEEGFV